MRALWPVVLLLFMADATAEEIPPGPFKPEECLECHTEKTPGLVADWRQGPHGGNPGAGCTECHGDSHGDLPASRSDRSCAGCHGGAVEHSYRTSKHGVLTGLEKPDLNAPLRRGLYRAPGCAYCHLHDGDHGDSMSAQRGPSVRDWICSACHAPRYVRRMFESGERLIEVGQMKIREANEIAGRHPDGQASVQHLLDKAETHLRNVRLGAGHQSPDYQWWHGQPALDGDLIRIRDRVAKAVRIKAVSEADREKPKDRSAARTE